MFYSARTETTHKSWKVAAEKNFFSSLYFIHATCFDESFLFHVILEDIIIYKFWSLFWHFFNHHIVAFFVRSLLKEVPILLCLHNNSAALILKFQKSIKSKIENMENTVWKQYQNLKKIVQTLRETCGNTMGNS